MPLVKPEFFTKNDDQVIFSPYKLFWVAAVVIVIIPLAIFPFLGGRLPLDMVMILVGILALLALPFLWISTKKVIVDRSTRSVICKNAFGESKRIPIDKLQLKEVVDATYGAKNGAKKFTLVPADNPYAKGIVLHMPLPEHSPGFQKIRNEAVPFIREMMKGEKPVVNTESRDVLNMAVTSHELFAERDGLYVSKRKVFPLIFGLLFLGFGIYSLTTANDYTYRRLRRSPWYSIILGLGILAFWSFHSRIDTTKRTISFVKFFGLMKKEYSFDDVKEYFTVRHMSYGIFSFRH